VLNAANRTIRLRSKNSVYLDTLAGIPGSIAELELLLHAPDRVAAIAAFDANDQSHPRLIGAQLEPFLLRWIAQNRDDFARVKRGEVGNVEERTVEEWERGDKERNEVCDALYSLADKILSLTATTKEGLAVQLRAITATDAELWENKTWGAAIPAYYHEREDDRYLAFFESACAVLGVVPVSIEAMMERQSRGGMDADNPPPA
jgi:hypothetical protein